MRLVPAILFALSSLLASEAAVAAKTLNQAVQQVQRQTDGRILSADTLRRGDRWVHRVKVLTPNGHVRVISVDGGPVRERGRDR